MEQHNTLVHNLALIGSVSLLVSCATAIILASLYAMLPALIWFILAAFWSCVLLYASQKMSSRPSPSSVTGRYLLKAEYSALVYGILWGSLPYIFRIQDTLGLLLVTLSTVAMASGLSSLISNIPRIVFRFALGAFFPLIVFFLMDGSSVGLTLSATAPVLVLALTLGGRSSYNQIIRLVSAHSKSSNLETVLHGVIDSLEGPFAIYDARNNLLKCNSSYAGLIETSEDELLDNQQIKIDDLWYATQLKNVQGVGRIHALTDITKLKNKEAELSSALIDVEEADSAKSRFLSAMSHELRTPLNIILGFSSIMTTDSNIDVPTQKVAEYNDDVHAQAKILQRLIDDIIQMASLEHHVLLDSSDVFDLNSMIKEVINSVNYNYQDKRIRWKLSAAQKPVNCVAEKNSYRSSLFHLIDNAAKFSNSGELVHISILQRNGAPVIKIADTGCGMSEEDVNNSVQPFWQSSATLDISQRGTGLGLSIVQRVTNLHGGKLSIKSTPGKGTTIFWQMGHVQNSGAHTESEAA